MKSFAEQLVLWQKSHGRHHLPWQNKQHGAYGVWLSEIMLQQTQVSTVIPYYERFLTRFPTVQALAAASLDEVLSLWAGLGYYARARNLHRCAKQVCERFEGVFPSEVTDLVSLPGIGQSTAHAIAAFCFGQRTPIMDGNVKRVFARYYAIAGYDRAFEKRLWEQAWLNVEQAPTDLDMSAYTQGLMDLGATVCTRHKPACQQCPMNKSCQAYLQGNPLQFPSKKPKKALPKKEACFLFLQEGGSVFLQKRPEKGIWGGLWCLPEFTDEASLYEFLLDKGINFPVQKMATLTHKFTHFECLIKPYYVYAQTLHESVISMGALGQWFDLSDLSGVGLPQPMATLLQHWHHS